MLSMIKLFIIAQFLYWTTAQKLASNDDGLHKACDFMKGTWTERSQPSHLSATGDTCHFTFHNQWTQDQEQSDEFCDLYAPWRLIKSVPGEKTECVVEATFVCDPGWTQMYGMCFRMPQAFKRMSHAEAEEVCARSRSGGAKIAFMHRKNIVGVWERFYRGVEQIWVRASEAWKKYEVKVEHRNEGDALALAFTGDSYDFNVHSYSLIRVSGDVDLQVLCEYKPEMTIAEINYIGRRYSQIYWPSIPVENGIVIRSANHYSGDTDNWEVCDDVLRPFMTQEFEQFLPNDDYLKLFTANKPAISYSHGLGFERTHSGKQPSCAALNLGYRIQLDRSNDYTLKFQPPEPNQSCDNMRSSAIIHATDTAHLRSMPASKSAPVWCKVGKVKKYEAVVEPGWSAYKRPKSGKLWVHTVVKQDLTWDDAQAYCKKDGSRLTGIESYEEGKFLHEELMKLNPGARGIFIGGKRNPKCHDVAGFVKDPDHLCSRQNVFLWEEGVATTPIEDRLWTMNTGNVPNPNYAIRWQDCLQFRAAHPYWMEPGTDGYLDDVKCDEPSWFICGKWVEMREVQ